MYPQQDFEYTNQLFMEYVKVIKNGTITFWGRKNKEDNSSVFFRLYQKVILGYVTDLIISNQLKTESKIFENNTRRPKKRIFHFLDPTSIGLSNLKLGDFQDENIPSRKQKKNSKAHKKFPKKDSQLKFYKLIALDQQYHLNTKFLVPQEEISQFYFKSYTNFQTNILSDWNIFFGNKLHFPTTNRLSSGLIILK